MPRRRLRSPTYADVTLYEPPFRFMVRSRSGPGKHLVDIADFDGNGACGCTDFQVNLAPLLHRGLSAQDAFAADLADLRDYHIFEEDCLRCWHICQARGFSLALAIEKELSTQKKNPAAARKPPPRA